MHGEGLATHLIVLLLESLAALVGKLYYQWPILVLKGRLELEIDAIFETRALSIHD